MAEEYKKTSIEFPHMINEKVWYMLDNEVVEGEVFTANVSISSQLDCFNFLPNKYTFQVNYRRDYRVLTDKQLFHSKQELLDSL